MLPQKTYYPWYDEINGEDKHKSKQHGSLSGFMDDLNLYQFYETLRRSYNITEIKQLSRLHYSDLLTLGMTSWQVNRLVDRLLDVGVAPGHLLSDSGDLPPSADSCYPLQQHQQQPQLLFYPPTHNHAYRPVKLFRKLFQRKQSHHHQHYASAPVSPLHAPNPVWRSDHHYRISTTPNPLEAVGRHESPHSAGALRYSAFDGCRHSARMMMTASSYEEDTLHPSPAPPLVCIIPEQDIRLHDRIGLGSFGVVRRADWSKPSGEVLPVAVKLLRPEAVVGDQFTSFLDELHAMQCLSHPNLIRLHGVVLSNPIMFVTELAPLGNLLLHLRAAHWGSVGSPVKSSTNNSLLSPPTSSTRSSVPQALQADSLWDMAVQVAMGMAYLSTRGLVHRDLAARNLLLASVQPVTGFPLVKIGDFGLVRFVGDQKQSRETTSAGGDTPATGAQLLLSSDRVYIGKQRQRIPFAWCAPESLGPNRLFSQASDVWSWGVTCWEMWTGGAAPWAGFDASQLLRSLRSGQRLAWPRLTCPRRLYQLMLACWRWQPQRRPTFAYLADRLDAIRPFEVTAEQSLDEADRLGLEIGDVVVVIDGCAENFWWRGQNRRTGEIGSFPRAVVRLANTADIGRPNPRSLVRTGHLDPNGRQSGHLDKLEAPQADIMTTGYPDSITYAYSPSLFSCHSLYQEKSDLDKGLHQSSSFSSELYSPQGPAGDASLSGLSTSDQQRYDQPDDDDDERILLDSTAHATFGVSLPIGGRVRLRNPLVGTNESDLDETMLSSTSSVKLNAKDADVDRMKRRSKTAGNRPDTTRLHSTDYSRLPDVTELRPPPGPGGEEDDSPVVASAHRSSRHLSAKAAQLPSNRLKPVASPSRSPPTSEATVEPSAPPLIDLYSPVVVNPYVPQFPASDNNANSIPMFGVPTTPSFGLQPNPTTATLLGHFPTPPVVCMSTRCPPQPPVSVGWAMPARPAPVPSSSTSSGLSGWNPFDTHLLDSLLPDPPNTPVPDVTATTANNSGRSSLLPPPPPSRRNRVRCEKQVLVSRAAVDPGPDPPPGSGSRNRPTSQLADSSQPESHPDWGTAFYSHREDQKAAGEIRNGKSDASLSVGSDGVGLLNQLTAICAQVPGTSLNEARHALAFLSNPFVPIYQYLGKPALPSAPPPPSSSTADAPQADNRRQDLVPLAVRLLLANRLASLGMSDWSTGCRVLTVFHWNLASAADWLAERLPNQRM